MTQYHRRDVLGLGVTGLAMSMLGSPAWGRSESDDNPTWVDVPIRRITREPGYHWFGYYDKFQTDPTDRYALGMRVNFEHRTPEPDDVIEIGLIDMHRADRWSRIGTSRAWGWQQGCMLQWRPGSDTEVLWNDREGDRFVTRIFDIETSEMRTIGSPVYAVSPDGKWAVTADFRRIDHMRPGYGYVGLEDPHADERAPAESGISRVDLETGETELILSLAEIVDIPHGDEDLAKSWHWFNHLLVNTDGTRFVFLHRWRQEMATREERAVRGWTTRMITANADGSEPFVIGPYGLISHFIWRDPEHICAWTRPPDQPAGFYLLRDRTHEPQIVGEDVMTRDGHNTYLPNTNNEWILNDGYPRGEDRLQPLYLYHIPSNRRVELGGFHSPSEYRGETRCDLHPRATRDGRSVIIDSVHETGRQMYKLDVSEIVDG